MKQNVDKSCIFCKILDGSIPSRVVYEDDEFKAILDVGAATKGHIIILPKSHVENIFEISDDKASKIYVLAKKIATALKNAYQCDGVNILQNNGKYAGQTVFHLHMHVIPRYMNDNVQIKWPQHDDYDLDKVLEEIKKEL